MAKDIIHEAVKNALIKDSWEITDDPLYVYLAEDDRSFEIDLGADKVIGARREGRSIAVEIKSFAHKSILNSFHTALGQYLDYREALNEANEDRDLYLAVSQTAYWQLEEIRFIQRRMVQYNIKLVVIDIEEEKVILWKN